jgi:hypothetical protein
MFCLTNTVLAQIDGDAVEVHPVMKMKFDDPGSSLARIHSSAAGDPDTTYIGHIGTAGARPAPYHGVAGGYGPFHIGSGPARSNGTTAGRDGAWTWDDFQAGETDSLQGWWPYRHNYPFTEIASWPDDQRPWWCLDFGNVVNYVINQGTGNKRTFGITGMWHRDPGNTVPGPGTVGVSWSPSGAATSVGTSGSFSAWCGVRAHGDLTAIDQNTGAPGAGTGALGGTGNYFNEESVSASAVRPPRSLRERRRRRSSSLATTHSWTRRSIVTCSCRQRRTSRYRSGTARVCRSARARARRRSRAGTTRTR